ncbi:hypothetical protein ACQJBY_008030 [Aegilops geniculata]
MASRSWLFLLLGLAASVLQARGQSAPDSRGFISIDCGRSEQSGSYVDELTKLRYTTDAGFTDAGSNHNVSVRHTNPEYTRRYPQAENVRSFPGAVRSCYTLRPIVSGSKYLLRASFMYGNYDGLNMIPVFDLYLGVNFWATVNFSKDHPDMAFYCEIITVLPEDSVQVCLVDTGLGTPFISWLELRPIKNTLYPHANVTQALAVFTRRNFGGDRIIRFPEDPYDRPWFPWNETGSLQISTEQKVERDESTPKIFHAPSVVMQTAITTPNVSTDIEFGYNVRTNHVYPKPRHVFVLHFSELEILPRNAVRLFSISVDNWLWCDLCQARNRISRTFYNIDPFPFYPRQNFTIKAVVPNSTLPPVINAAEFFSVISMADLGTFTRDAHAIKAIKKTYQVKKNWEGDPCAPKTLAWDGLNCSYPVSDYPRITNVNMSFSSLSGDISTYFAQLEAIQHLNLSHNKLTGLVPNVLSELSSLEVLDLTDNQLSGTIPPGLLKRVQDGSLTLRYSDNPSLCSNSSSCYPTEKNNSMLAVYVVAPILIVIIVGLLVALLLIIRKGQKKTEKGSAEVQSELSGVRSHFTNNDGRHRLLQIENRRFTYRELEFITNNFHRVLGRGGFGIVYAGFLEDGTQVAVKLRSQCSHQGITEFLAEARNLTRIHHKNLVSLIGYCKDGDYLALVYEHMSEGNLQDKLRGNNPNIGRLTWKQRLCIALESAQGLEYLHKACSPPFIHRDVKTSNILLNANLKAKVSDFGLLKAFNHDDDTHASTARVVGTQGYLAPEYVASLQLTEKSDVYSFGVVLLEVVTGQPPILQSPEPTSIVEWARECLVQGKIENIVDDCMRGDYDVNSVWKAAKVALKCTKQAPAQRYTMTEVVARLQECLELEESRTNADDSNSSYGIQDIEPSTNIGQSNWTSEMEHHYGKALATGLSIH